MNFEERPSLGYLFSNAFKAYKSNIKIIILIVLIINIPIELANALIPSTALSFDASGSTTNAMASMMESLKDNIEYTIIILIIQYFLAPLATMAIAIACKNYILEQKNDLVTSLNKSFSSFSRLASTVIIFIALLMLTSFTIIIPIYLAVIYFFYVYAVALSDKSGYAALKYSASLVKGRWFYVFYFCIIIFLTNSFIAGFIDFAFSSLFSFFTPVVSDVLTGVISSIVGAYFVCVVTIWFLKLDESKRISTGVL